MKLKLISIYIYVYVVIIIESFLLVSWIYLMYKVQTSEVPLYKGEKLKINFKSM